MTSATATAPTVAVLTHEAIGPALDWMVAQALGYTDVQITAYEDPDTPDTCFFRPTKIVHGVEVCGSGMEWLPSTDLAQGARLIEQDKIGSEYLPTRGIWWAKHPANRGGLIRYYGSGPTQLVACMRCLVHRYLGEKVSVPAELVAA